ncbi:MAG: hypothetical protein ACYC6R_02375 [Anaerolineales bacterium]
MLRRLDNRLDDMALAIIVWMCTLPLIGMLVLPLFGLNVGLMVAAVLLIAILVICWGICSWKNI